MIGILAKWKEIQTKNSLDVCLMLFSLLVDQLNQAQQVS